MKAQHVWTTEWTGHYPCHCHGEWRLFCDGEEVDLKEVGCPWREDADAGTFGEYPRWYFESDWSEHWYYTQCGKGQKAWCRNNADWLRNLGAPFDWREIYKAFRANDWRPGCCGGCI